MNVLKEAKKTMLAVLKGALFFLMGALVLTAIFYFFTINEVYMSTVRTAVMLLSAFFGGLWASKGEKSKGYLRGLCSGLILTALFIFIRKFSAGAGFTATAVTYLLMLIISVIGGMIGINVK